MGLKKSINKRIARLKYPLKKYIPKIKKTPEKMLQIESGWKGLEEIIEDILNRFDIERNNCIEFGSEFCYSTVVFSNFFKKVKGVDIFIGDIHSGEKQDHYKSTSQSIAEFKNIELVKSDYRDYVKQDDTTYDLAHIDIIHTYKETYECGLWAIKHSKCCVFHDTESFPEVRRAVYDLAKHTGKTVYNYPYHNELGIIV